MLFKIIRIFLLLFVPMGIWVVYSWDDASFLNLPKIDKVELLKLTYMPPQETVQKTITIKKIVKNIHVDINTSSTRSIQENNETCKVDFNTSMIHKTYVVKKTDVDTNENNNTDKNDSSTAIAMNERVFIIGDSMGEGLAYGMENIKNSFHLKVKSIAKCSTTTYFWLADQELESKIEAFKPTLILVALGTNEWNGVSNGTKLRIMKIHNRLAKLDINTVWVTPPVPKSTQFYNMVHETYGDSIYDSRFIDLPRGPDKIHPTLKGYITWSKKILYTLKNTGVLE
jgi:hypothetical protein